MSPSIDSLKIRLPLPLIDVLDSDLLDKWVEMNAVTGEVDETTYKQKSKQIYHNGVSTRYAFVPRRDGFSRTDEIHILVNSKLLGSDYKKGITNETIGLIWNAILSHGLIKCTLDTFVESGLVSDVDIKLDEILNGGFMVQAELVKQMNKLTKPNTSKRKGSNASVRPDKIICEWGDRAKATKSAPFCKVYAKDIQAKHEEKMNAFCTAYGVDFEEGYTRLEVTIKNKKMLEYLWGKKLYSDMTLEYMLNLTDEEKKKLIRVAFSKHLEHYKRREMDSDNKLSRSDLFCLLYLKEMGSLQLALNKVGSVTDDKEMVYRMRKQIKDIWESEIEGSDQGDVGGEMDKVFNILGIGAES